MAVLLFFVHRLPAPIQEVPETPTPPAVAPQSKPLPKSKPKSEPGDAATNSAPRQMNPKQSRFAGTWVGTMAEVPWGNVATALVVDQTEATIEWQEGGKRKGLTKAKLTGNTLQASFPGWAHPTWSLATQPDGATALVRLQAFMNDQTAVFHRTVVQSSAAKPAR